MIRCAGGGILVALFAAGLGGCASSANIQPVADKPVIEVRQAEQTRPIQFRKIVIKLKRGEDIGAVEAGVMCAPHAELTFRGGRMTLDDEELTETFRHELEIANYQVVGDPDALFDDPSSWKAEYLVAGLVKRMNANICYPMLGWGSTDAKGEAFMEVQWQIYNRLDRKVVYELTTQGSSDVTDSRPSGETDVFLDAFAQATRNLLGDQGFYDLIVGGGAPVEQATSMMAAPSAFVPRAVFTQAIAANMEAVRNNVVVVYAGDGHGSGFVIDDDGRLLTNAHVVGAAERVKVRFESGEEVTAVVLAVDTRRDVALLKINRAGTGGLPIRFDAPIVGAEVYAVGAPLDPSYSATVSKGIVSALRTFDGERWIQSDVNVQHGNSGGPLLDDHGNIIGITSRGAPDDVGALSGVNFFVPITDALDRLGLSPKAAAS
jgi:serine protease Do